MLSTKGTIGSLLMPTGMAAAATAIWFAAGTHAAGPLNTVRGTELRIEPPTLMSLGFEWQIEGDGNRNASVAIEYRKKGTDTWQAGLPLRRLQNEHIGGVGTSRGFSSWDAPNMFAGSLFDLEADTAYDVRLTLSDPDGVNGETMQFATVRTRPEPMPAADGRVFHVYPFDYKGPRQEPAFTGLMAAYFYSANNIDSYRDFGPRVRPGDTILVHAGLYRDDNRIRYAHGGCCQTGGDGTYFLTAKGTAEQPIAIKAAGDGEVIFDGAGNWVLFDMTASEYNYFEGITFRDSEYGILAGRKDIIGAVGLTVKHSKFENVGIGIFSDWQGSREFYIADNELVGRNIDVDKGEFVVGFLSHDTPSFYAIKIYGSGHVVAHNRVRWFHDGIDFASFGRPDPKYGPPVSNDFYNNDIANLHDDCMEADGASFNMRILRNRCVNVNDAVSTQPLFGGPLYVIRNIMYSSPLAENGAFKTIGAQGYTLLNNTFLADKRGTIRWKDNRTFDPSAPGPRTFKLGPDDQNHYYRNNLILAMDPERPAMDMSTLTRYSTSDYNGFMAGSKAPLAFDFSWPPEGTMVEHDLEKLQQIQAKTLEELQRATGREMHSLMVDFSVFKNLQPADPNDPTKLYDPDSLDFTLNPSGRAIDAGVVLPNITDGFAGKAPDLGAYELGQPIPHYGPRPAR